MELVNTLYDIFNGFYSLFLGLTNGIHTNVFLYVDSALNYLIEMIEGLVLEYSGIEFDIPFYSRFAEYIDISLLESMTTFAIVIVIFGAVATIIKWFIDIIGPIIDIFT